MPIKSESQRKYLWANHPDLAKEWDKETPKGKKLPKKVKKKAQYGADDTLPDTYNPPNQINDPFADLSPFMNYMQDPNNQALLDRYRKAGYSINDSNNGNNINFSRGTGVYDLSNKWKGINTGIDVATGIANFIGNIKNNRQEQKDYLEFIQPHIYDNKDELGRNPAPIYFQTGGATNTRKPIIVESKNDPRLKAYNDSLTQYNGGEQQIKDIIKKGIGEYEGKYEKLDLNNGKYVPKGKMWEREKEYFTSIGLPQFGPTKRENNGPDNPNNRAIGYMSYPYDKTIGLYNIAKYQKPVQPVIYQKSTPPPEVLADPAQYQTQVRGTIISPQPNYYNMEGTIPVYGPSGSLIGMGGDDGSFSPDYMNTAERKNSNKLDIELLKNPKALEQYIKNKGYKNVKENFQTGGRSANSIIAEAGEVYQSPDQQIFKIGDHLDDHDDASGGVKINNAERILEDTGDKRNDPMSKALLLKPDELLQLTGVKSKKPVTHSKAFELAKENNNKELKFTEKYLKKNVDDISSSPNNIYAKNSLNLNLLKLDTIPTDGETFDKIFDHQESIKNLIGMAAQDDKAQYGGIKSYRGDKFNKTNASKYSTADWQKFAQDVGFPGGDTRKFQEFLFNMNGDRGTPDLQTPIIGLHEQFGNPNTPPSSKSIYNWFDNRLGHRWDAAYDTYYNNQPQDGVPQAQNPTGDDYLPLNTLDGIIPQDQNPSQQQGSNRSINTIPNPTSQFKAPLKWYDTAAATSAYLGALQRKNVKYNGIDIIAPQAKYIDPAPQLAGIQGDYNAGLNILPENGVGYANQANLFAQKYKADNQVLGNTNNINNGIWNQNEQAVVNTKNSQSQADQQARQVFETKQLQGMSAQRQQLFQSLKDITGTIAANARYQREGNLLLKLFPNFDQKGNYNNNPFKFTNPASTSSPLQNKLQEIMDAAAAAKKKTKK
jgi:hypothetical protein